MHLFDHFKCHFVVAVVVVLENVAASVVVFISNAKLSLMILCMTVTNSHGHRRLRKQKYSASK